MLSPANTLDFISSLDAISIFLLTRIYADFLAASTRSFQVRVGQKKTQLLYSNCVPKLTYGAAVKDYNAFEKNQLNEAVNNAIRRIFGFRLWQSIRQIREFYGYDAIEVMIAKARKKFVESLRFHDNYVLRLLSTLDT